MTDQSPKCLRAIENLRRPARNTWQAATRSRSWTCWRTRGWAADDQILAVPTVVRRFPEPIRKFVGDLSDTDRLLVGLQLRPLRDTSDMTDTADDRWTLTLYVDGGSTSSIQAIETVRRVCDEELGAGHVDLEVIDVRQQPALVARDQIVAPPTLVRRSPGPPRRIVGDSFRPRLAPLGLDPAAAGATDAESEPDE